MRKSHLLFAAGTAIFVCGCVTQPIATNKPVIPAPELDPPAQSAPVIAEQPVLPPDPAMTPAFKPMTDVTSTGGIETPVKPSTRGKKSSAKSRAAQGNVYIVKSGDTPERIARRLRINLSAFMEANNLDQASARRLQIGQKLVIPTGAAARRAPRKSTAAKKTVTGRSATASSGVTPDGFYIVKSGDTPERIARRLRIRLSDLLSANNLDQESARRLQIGQKLAIPGKATAQKAPQTETTVTTSETNTDTTGGTTQSGDAATTTDAAATGDNANSGTTPSGDTTATGDNAGSGDQNTELAEVDADCTLEEYASKHNIDPAWLSKFNSGKTNLKKGEMIFVPAKPQQ